MSQSVEIVILVEGLAELFGALAEAGAAWRAERRLRASDGVEHEVDYVATDPTGATVGVKVDPRTQRAVFVPQDCAGGKGQALAGRVAQAWARSRVVAELQQKGYQLAKEEKRADGSVRLVLQRWR
jgi:hypothetical protein